ncbi:EamA family transporter [Pandoraea nosoerga]|uniref:Multidrug DMT transporter permease n=1 Tax=Pandoraea nosoerga TaxID=2508296 RepID=A0A5E4XT85_9BURK|nr:EamA family transporter [Pandoraea nosoerga]MBN4667545.1 EamA family transporter [Pandoraea nosoerga]MBN4674875.1 EamA family transporter [Pandoraea nosoerga]MBN4680191.1 EamA family transporter [Pandoraea nosoerga]MBN4744575.1 EamA family transporter [Pandoraea nosoerga]VVE39671.1 multidrug DMT transporter permease [Pandoraea nosoerga]
MTTTPIVLLVLLSALMHATWNAFLHASPDRVWQVGMMAVPQLFAALAGIVLLPLPPVQVWPLVLLSACAQVAYTAALIRAYRVGEFGQIYPIARGISPLLISGAALLLAGEWPTWTATIGIVGICAGILTLALRGRRLSGDSVPAALLTGVFIAAYTIVDGFGVRLSNGNGFGYIAWAYLFASVPLVGAVWALRGGSRGMFLAGRRRVTQALGAGVVAQCAYGMVVFALQFLPMGVVSALRESSAIFAVLLGWLFLGEKLNARRLAACALVVGGAVLIKLGA